MSMETIEKLKPFIKDFIRYYRDDLGHVAGGAYHIVLSEGNLDPGDIRDCQAEAKATGDSFGIFLGELLRCFTTEELEEMFENNWE